MIGRAVQRFGQDLGKVAENLTEIQKQDAETAAREADNVRMANRLKRLYEGPEGYYNQEGKNALLDRDQLDEDLKSIDDDAAKLLEHKPFARKLFDDMTLKRNSDDLPKIMQHAHRERNRFENQVDSDAFDLAIDNASSSEDPRIIEENIQTVGDIAERKARRSGLYDENGVQQARQAGIGKAVGAVAQRMELQSPGEAQAFVIAHADQMDPEDANKLLSALAAPAAQERAGSDIAEFLVVSGSTAPAASGEAPAPSTAGTTPMPSMAALDAAMFTAPNSQESGGKHIDPNTGELLTSSAGAKGISQVMFDTGYDPGYGVKPLQNQSREEYLRFGHDYREALIKHYGSVVLGVTAYNWGPGNVDAHIAKVGNPVKGEISDASWINSIPVKEAREYTPSVLSKAGVSIAGVSGPNVGKPVQVGQEIDIDATINNIRNSDRTYVEKQALIAEANRMHGYGRQVRAEREEALTDEAWQAVNGMKNGFTDYNQLPLSLRTRMETFSPKLVASLRSQAESNAQAVETEKAHETELDLLELQYEQPQAFAQIDFRTAHPELSHEKRTQMMERQDKIRTANEGGDVNRVDYDAIRSAIGRYKGKNTSGETLGKANDYAFRKAEEWVKDNPGKALPDAVREGIAREAMMRVTVERPGALWGTRREVMTRAEVEGNIKEKGKPRNLRVDPREQVRAELEQVWGRTPSEDEITREVEIRIQRGTYSK
jgi:soluble lytic murein transglycosylase-like protein